MLDTISSSFNHLNAIKMMTVGDLKEMLEGLDPEAEVRFASQPSWPFEYSINDIYITVNGVYLVEGTQLGYLPDEVKEGVGW